MRVYVTVPVRWGDYQWLRELGVDTTVRQEVDVIGTTVKLERTRWYIDMPDKVATLYKLKYSERTL